MDIQLTVLVRLKKMQDFADGGHDSFEKTFPDKIFFQMDQLPI